MSGTLIETARSGSRVMIFHILLSLLIDATSLSTKRTHRKNLQKSSVGHSVGEASVLSDFPSSEQPPLQVTVQTKSF